MTHHGNCARKHWKIVLRTGNSTATNSSFSMPARQGSLLLPAVVEGELGLVHISTDADGVSVEKTPGIDATRTLYRVTFQNVAVTDDQILATGPAATDAWHTTLETMAVVVSAELLGLQEWMLAETVEYAKTRKQFDRTIGSFQAVQHKCGRDPAAHRKRAGCRLVCSVGGPGTNG